MAAPDPLLQVVDLTAQFTSGGVGSQVVKRISFDIAAGEAVGFVGESGCGKSVTARAMMRLAPEGSSVKWGGSIQFRGQDLLHLQESAMLDLRGRRIAMVFQDPMTSLNPVMTVGAQIDDMVRRHTGASAKAARKRTVELLGLVGIRDPERRANDYPHQFSGGMRQRVLIAIAKSCVISIIAMPSSWRSRISKRRIWACTVTSSAVVGSSAISSSGSHDTAMAINTRCRMPPENWCG